MNYKMKTLLLLVISVIFVQFSLKGQNNVPIDKPAGARNSKKEVKDVLGFGFLIRIPGLWNGPVTSSTPAGSFEKWYVDFRPVSAGQVSQYSMLDSQTVNITSFFIVKYNGQIKVAMRTEGCFAKSCCVTYEVMDSVNEAKGYYRFSDFVAGPKRAFTEFTFKANQFAMNVFTNKFNKIDTVQLHSKFEATLADRNAASNAIVQFGYPKSEMIKDFTDVFKNMTESIFFNLANDPYNSSSQPFVGSLTVNILIDTLLKTKSTDELCLLLTTEPLFNGLKYNLENLKYLSKYVYLPIGTKTYTIRNVHPGKYYLYSYNDKNNDKKHMTGDYMSSNINNVLTVLPNDTVTVNTRIDMIIP